MKGIIVFYVPKEQSQHSAEGVRLLMEILVHYLGREIKLIAKMERQSPALRTVLCLLNGHLL